jgi:hypothetical protein
MKVIVALMVEQLQLLWKEEDNNTVAKELTVQKSKCSPNHYQ